ncbi:adenylosuccinate synthetase [Xenophilus arseniciresistens]|uniref:Adenylosuccinate synthetase n=1 Tax=Xenophilus arseniciresistens TaxID=1283306 RepID=A0AAE3T1G9_9BURK|nr:adenylosuccinate synthetase [Xenophilus arseniciresistens]MDA7418565.1 adenylosuccinate synthetase [Xenophilus arseniciresistens]
MHAPPLSTRYIALLGLGFGDCGKGVFTDYLCRRLGAHTVVRFNGGAQAGHNVVLPDGRHHTFSQWGAGSLAGKVATVLATPVVVHPHALVYEAAALQAVGMVQPFARLHIDAHCRVTTPLHQAAGRLREWARGSAAHGSCGVGVGETVLQGLRDPDAALRYGDLVSAPRVRAKLAALREALQRDADLHHVSTSAAQAEWRVLRDESLAERWLDAIAPVLHGCPPASKEAIAHRLTRPGTVVLEGAQGVLLDERHGFHPHTTWSSVSTDAVQAVLADLGITRQAHRLGVLRSYLTRHGAGPLPTHDEALNVLAEPHNADEGWQGRFRRGHPDAVLLAYAVRAVGTLDGLVASHLDVFERTPLLRWCTGYRSTHAAPDDGALLRQLPVGTPGDLTHNAALTQLLFNAQPVYDPLPLQSVAQWQSAVEACTGLPVLLGSHGPTHADVRARPQAALLE